MKRIVGALAVLVFLAAMAVGQQSKVVPSFPADANPSRANNAKTQTSGSAAELPSAMAANQAGTSAEQSDWDKVVVPFPAAANPAKNGANAQTSTSAAELPSAMAANQAGTSAEQSDWDKVVVPFPAAANRSKN